MPLSRTSTCSWLSARKGNNAYRLGHTLPYETLTFKSLVARMLSYSSPFLSRVRT